MIINWEDEKPTVIIFDDDELTRAIRAVEFMLELYIGADTSSVEAVLEKMRRNAGKKEKKNKRTIN